MKAGRFSFLIFTFLISCSAVTFPSCSKRHPAKAEVTSFTAMNTYMTVKSYGNDSKILASANYLVQQEIEWLESILSTTIEGSDIYKLNESTENDNFSITENSLHSETAYLITRSHELYEQTGGAFNPALYPVIKEWGFTTGEYKVPSEEKIQQLLEYTDFSKITISEKASSPELLPADYDKADPAPLVIIDRPAGMQLDFGAIGKGYAGDKAIEILRKADVSSALLDFGGNIQVLGTKPDGSDWTVGIKNPWGGEPVAAVKLRDACMITSGGYERFFTAPDGHKYIHIFDGSTGRPVENNLESVTIICREGLYGDALSTSLFVMGLDKAVEFWQSGARDFDFVIITKDKGLVYSAPLEKNISLLFDFDSVRVVD